MSSTLESITNINIKNTDLIAPKLQEELVTQEVLEQLGTPDNLYKIDANNVYDSKWRVDVWIEEWKEESTGPSYRIAHSYFCTIQDNCILKSNPEILPLCQ